MAANSGTSVDTMLADAIAKMDAMTKRMDALETGQGSKNPIKGDASKKSDDDDDKKDDATAPKHKILDDDDDDDKKDDAFPPKKKDDSAKKSADEDKKDDDDDDDKKDDDGELEIKHKGKEEKGDTAKKDSKKADAAKKADAKKADDDDKKDDDDDDKKDDDDDDKKSDAARADDVAALRRTVAEQQAMLQKLSALMKPRTDEEHSAFADTQARADTVFNGFGQRAPRPLEGEELLSYRKRLARQLKMHSPKWKSAKFRGLDEEIFTPIEEQIYADAVAAAANPIDLTPGELREVKRVDGMGRTTIEFYGKEHFTKAMGRPGRRVQSFRTLASQ